MTPEQLVAEAQRALSPRANGHPVYPPDEEPDPRRFALTPLSDMLNEPPEDVKYVWEHTLPAAGASITAAKPKAGKSTAARALGLAVGRGVPFLGRATTQGPVLYLALEEKRSEVITHFRRMGATNEPVHVHTGGAPDQAMEALTAAVHELRPVLTIIDPLFKLVRIRDANDYAEVNRAMEPLLALARQSGTHLLAVHHAGKGGREGADAVLGSTALFGAVDTLLLLRRGKDNVRTIEATTRYGQDLPETVITMDPLTGAIAEGGTIAEVQLEHAMGQVLEELSMTEERTEPEIRDAIGGNTGLVGKALRRLVSIGQALRSGNGKRGSPYQYRKPLPEEACPL